MTDATLPTDAGDLVPTVEVHILRKDLRNIDREGNFSIKPEPPPVSP